MNRHDRRPKTVGLLCKSAFLLTLTSPAVAIAESPLPGAVLRHHLGTTDGVSEKGDFDPSFLALNRENARLAGGLDVLDYDPVCQCQDTGGAQPHISGKLVAPDLYRAVLRSGAMTWTVDMRNIGGAWKFYDVIEGRGSLRNLLERHNSCAREKIAHRQKPTQCVFVTNSPEDVSDQTISQCQAHLTDIHRNAPDRLTPPDALKRCTLIDHRIIKFSHEIAGRWVHRADDGQLESMTFTADGVVKQHVYQWNKHAMGDSFASWSFQDPYGTVGAEVLQMGQGSLISVTFNKDEMTFTSQPASATIIEHWQRVK